MSKFGELIDVDVPVLFAFDKEWDESTDAMHLILKYVAAALGDKAKVIKINVEKNNDLAEALRIKSHPTLIIYKDGDMKWRQSGAEDSNTLISKLNEYL